MKYAAVIAPSLRGAKSQATNARSFHGLANPNPNAKSVRRPDDVTQLTELKHKSVSSMSVREQAKWERFMQNECFSEEQLETIALLGTLYWLEVDGRAVSVLNVHQTDDAENGFLSNICTAKASLRRGMAQKLIQETIKSWKRKHPGAKTMALDVWTDNVGAIKLYEKLGFRTNRVQTSSRPKTGRMETFYSMALNLKRK